MTTNSNDTLIPHWLRDIHLYDAIEIDPLTRFADDYDVAHGPGRPSKWGVFLHLKTGGREDIALYDSKAEAEQEAARLEAQWPHLSGPWALTAPHESRSSTIVAGSRKIARVYAGDDMAKHIMDLHNAVLARHADSDYTARHLDRVSSAASIAGTILRFRDRSHVPCPMPRSAHLMSRALASLTHAFQAVDDISDVALGKDGQPRKSLPADAIETIFTLSTGLLVEMEHLMAEMETELHLEPV